MPEPVLHIASTLHSDMKLDRVFTVYRSPFTLIASAASIGHDLLKEILCYPWPCSVVSDCPQEQLK